MKHILTFLIILTAAICYGQNTIITNEKLPVSENISNRPETTNGEQMFSFDKNETKPFHTPTDTVIHINSTPVENKKIPDITEKSGMNTKKQY